MDIGGFNGTPSDDNYGFAGWVQKNSIELFKLGEGKHFGEWWGLGIQRRYDQKEKRFSLFNTARWKNITPVSSLHLLPVYEDSKGNQLPSCVSLVPVLYTGAFDNLKIKETLDALAKNGSVAAPGFMNPEGIVIFHVASRNLYKVTIKDDDKAKSEV